MAVRKIDPRYNRDRVYQHDEYRLLAANFGKPKRKAWYEIIPLFSRGQSKAPHAIRLLPYKLAVSVAVVLTLGSYAVMGALDAESSRLDYEGQKISSNQVTMDQSIEEARGAIIEAEGVVFSSGVVPASEITYPAMTKELVFTNIPEASGKKLIQELYPLSKELICIEP